MLWMTCTHACGPFGQHSNGQFTLTLTVVYISHNNNTNPYELKTCITKHRFTRVRIIIYRPITAYITHDKHVPTHTILSCIVYQSLLLARCNVHRLLISINMISLFIVYKQYIMYILLYHVYDH